MRGQNIALLAWKPLLAEASARVPGLLQARTAQIAGALYSQVGA